MASSKLSINNFLIVGFVETNEADIIHKNWLVNVVGSGSYSYWPNFSANSKLLANAIKTATNPDPVSWKIFEVEILKGYGKRILRYYFCKFRNEMKPKIIYNYYRHL